MVYAGILAHGTSMSAAEKARMMPQLSATSVRQAMRWAGYERRLADAGAAVLAFMRQHPIAVTWGRSGLASSDMMSLETRQRVWQARLDPRRQTSSVGVYGHVLAGWGILSCAALRAQRTASRPRTEGKSTAWSTPHLRRGINQARILEVRLGRPPSIAMCSGRTLCQIS
jgi:hypothetical protein